MADSPRLPVTAEASTYAPFSFTAILALCVAGLFAVILVLFGGAALIAGQPFNQPVFLVLPIAALVLSFAARRQILSSEGTRDGMQLANAAWWIAMAGGAVYASILMGTAYALRVQAADAFTAWSANLVDVNPVEVKNPPLFRAFQWTLAPGQQLSYPPTQMDRYLAEKREEIAYFRQVDVVRIAYRNKGSTKFLAAGLQKWEQDAQQGVTCTLSAVMETLEGEFQLAVPMIRQPVEGTPRWQIKPQSQGYIQAARVTPYGQQVREMEYSAIAFTMQQVLPMLNTHAWNPDSLLQLKKGSKDWSVRETQDLNGYARVGAIGGAGWLLPTGKETERNFSQEIYFSGDSGRDAINRQRFMTALRSGQIAPLGVMSQSNTEMNPLMTVTEKLIEIRVPIDLRVNAMEQPCRGHVLLSCDDPQFLGKLNELRSSAATAGRTAYQQAQTPKFPWKLVRIESEMRPLPTPKMGPDPSGGGGMPGMPGMPGG